MVLEIAIFDIKPSMVERFEELGREVARYVEQGDTQGFHSFRLVKAIEDPNRFVFHVIWDRVEDHAALGETEFSDRVTAVTLECLASEPVVHHYTVVDGTAVGEIRI